MQVMARVGREYLLQIVAFAIAILDRLVVPAILLRSLGVEGFSGWTVAFAVAGFIPVLDFGVIRHFTNRLLMLCATDQTSAAQRTFRQGTILSVMLSGMTTVAFAALLMVMPPRTGDAATDVDMLAVVMPVLLALFVQQIIGMRQGLYRAYRNYGREILLRAVSDGLRIGIVATAALNGADLVTLAWLWLGAAIFIQVLPFLIDSRRRFPQFREGLEGFTRAEMLDIFSTAPGYWLQALLTTAFASLPIVGLGYWAVAPAAVAQFGLMRTVANVVRQVLQMFGNVFGLELGRRAVLDDKAGFASVFFETSRFMAAQSTVAAIVLLALGRELFTLWTGQASLYNVTMLLLAIAPPILIPSMIASTEAVAYAGKPWLIVQARVAQLAAGVVLVITLPILDIAMRMMASLAISEVLAFGIPLIFVIRQINPAVGFAMQARLGGLVLLSAVTAATIMAPLLAINHWSLAMRLSIGAILALVALAICVVVWGVDQARRAAVIALIRTRWRGTTSGDASS